MVEIILLSCREKYISTIRALFHLGFGFIKSFYLFIYFIVKGKLLLIIFSCSNNSAPFAFIIIACSTIL